MSSYLAERVERWHIVVHVQALCENQCSCGLCARYSTVKWKPEEANTHKSCDPRRQWFCALWPWPFDAEINGFPGLMVKHSYVNFGDPSCVCFWDIMCKDKQTNATENRPTRLSSVCVTSITGGRGARRKFRWIVWNSVDCGGTQVDADSRSACRWDFSPIPGCPRPCFRSLSYSYRT